MLEYVSRSIEDTQNYAAKLAAEAQPGDIICLCGTLGAGKTAFAQGFAKGLGVEGFVSSPTFTIMQMYFGRLPIYHFDLYRLAPEEFQPVTGDSDENAKNTFSSDRCNQLNETAEIPGEDLDTIDFFEYLEGEGVSLIEWAEYTRSNIPEHAIWIEIEMHDDYRIIRRN